MVNFRHRHARAVEKIIGRRVGTGGSSGVNYLDETTKIRVFHDSGQRVRYCCRKRDDPLLKTLIIIGMLGDLTKNRDYGTFT